MSNNETKRVFKRKNGTEDQQALMPKYLRDCVRWAMNIHRDLVMTEEELMKKFDEENEKLYRDPILIENSWMKYAYTANSGRRYPIGIAYINWPSADDAYDFLKKNLDYCDMERVNRVCERINRPAL